MWHGNDWLGKCLPIWQWRAMTQETTRTGGGRAMLQVVCVRGPHERTESTVCTSRSPGVSCTDLLRSQKKSGSAAVQSSRKGTASTWPIWCSASWTSC
ncbi:hypothetical protein SRHO_G00317310 [Serrasalmus rhombeus]